MITRKTADAYITHLQQMALEINQMEEYLYCVERLEVFGSYLTDKDRLGDLDVIVTLVPRIDDDAWWAQRHRARIDLAYEHGRTFRNITEEVCWPRDEIYRHLRQGKRGISLHEEGEKPHLTAQFETIFERRAP